MFWLFVFIVFSFYAYDTWKDARNPLWNEIAKEYGVEWKKLKGNVSTISFWTSNKNRYWFNDISVDVSDHGLGLYWPWSEKWYLKSILVPWENLDLDEESRTKLLKKSFMPTRLIFKIVGSDINFRIHVGRKESLEGIARNMGAIDENQQKGEI